MNIIELHRYIQWLSGEVFFYERFGNENVQTPDASSPNVNPMFLYFSEHSNILTKYSYSIP